MNNRTDHGFLVLADVSGFTAFVTTTELEHGSEIIAALLDEVIEIFRPTPIRVTNVRSSSASRTSAPMSTTRAERKTRDSPRSRSRSAQQGFAIRSP